MPMNSPVIDQRVQQLLTQGEGPALEFKSSLRWDYRDSRVNKELTKAVVRTLAVFLNTDGGTLLIGVADDGHLLDLEMDIATLGSKGIDGFELALRSAVAAYLGAEIDPQVRLEFVTLGDKRVAVASCTAYPKPVYFHDGDRRELCVRSGNLTRLLDVAAAVSYVEHHWKTAAGITAAQMQILIGEALAQRTPAVFEQVAQRPNSFLTGSTLPHGAS